jgi:cell wall-associated NlpC family hydrolase
VIALTAAGLLACAGTAGAAGTGGMQVPTTPVPGEEAKLNKDGTASPPAEAPREVVEMIEAANAIEDKPYEYGGGHGDFKDSGYDCSGAVSYALHAAGLLKTPMDSGGLMKWGKRGKGDWVTVYSNPGHAYMVIAGLRWDTSMTEGDGPGWSEERRTWRGL